MKIKAPKKDALDLFAERFPVLGRHLELFSDNSDCWFCSTGNGNAFLRIELCIPELYKNSILISVGFQNSKEPLELFMGPVEVLNEDGLFFLLRLAKKRGVKGLPSATNGKAGAR
jgi:hypothetical protein